MRIIAVDEHENEKPASRTPLWLVKRQTPAERKAGLMQQVRPYNAFLANDPEWKGVHALPAEFVKKMNAVQEKRAKAEKDAKAYNEAFLASVETRKTEFEEKLRKARTGKKVGKAEVEAQNDVDSEHEPENFVLSEATAPQIIKFMKANFNVELDPDKPVEELRKEAAGIAGIETE